MNTKEVVVLVAEDDEGHASLIIKGLRKQGFKNNILHFKDGREILDFFFNRGNRQQFVPDKAYILMLDIRMPRVDGMEVLRQMKQDKKLCMIPVIMITTIENPNDIERCQKLGCSVYITKPVDQKIFIEAIEKLGFFLKVIRLSNISGRVQ